MTCSQCGSEVAPRAVPREPDPQGILDPKAIEEVRVALVAVREWLSAMAVTRTSRGIPHPVTLDMTLQVMHRAAGALGTAFDILSDEAHVLAALAGRPVPPQEKKVNEKHEDALPRVDGE